MAAQRSKQPAPLAAQVVYGHGFCTVVHSMQRHQRAPLLLVTSLCTAAVLHTVEL
jgi:hypothetical protein